jgi:hypothetical protein
MYVSCQYRRIVNKTADREKQSMWKETIQLMWCIVKAAVEHKRAKPQDMRCQTGLAPDLSKQKSRRYLAELHIRSRVRHPLLNTSCQHKLSRVPYASGKFLSQPQRYQVFC